MTTELVKEFAHSLGWEKPIKHLHSADDNRSDDAISWYECGASDDLYLQVNLEPEWRVCVFAMRHQLCSGWYKVFCFDDEKSVEEEVQRLGPWIHRSWFDSESNRRKYINSHPECANYSWERLEKEGPPSTKY